MYLGPALMTSGEQQLPCALQACKQSPPSEVPVCNPWLHASPLHMRQGCLQESHGKHLQLMAVHSMVAPSC